MLTGGDLGSSVQTLDSNEGILSGTKCSPLTMVPVNGVDSIFESEAVPIDSGPPRKLWVQVKNVAGPGQHLHFYLVQERHLRPQGCHLHDRSPDPDRVQRPSRLGPPIARATPSI